MGGLLRDARRLELVDLGSVSRPIERSNHAMTADTPPTKPNPDPDHVVTDELPALTPMGAAAEFIALQLASGDLTHEDLARIVWAYQRANGLVPDGKPGPITRATLARQKTMAKCYPLRVLPDLRRPEITSGFRSRDRPDHDGVDLFYRYVAGRDAPIKVGDGFATRGLDGKPKWFIPEGELAIAAAGGLVSAAEKSPTGWRVWVNHDDGYRTGYFHLRNLRVRAGQHVPLGAPLGEVGDNPRDIDARHLHFEVSPIDRYAPIDPERWLVGATYFVGS